VKKRAANSGRMLGLGMSMGRFVLIAFLGVLSALAAAVLILPGKKLPVHPYFQGIGREVIAQRGGAGLGPENTLAAAQLSLAAHADALEFDLWMLRDGALALIHDPNLARTTGVAGEVEVMVRNDLERYDAGYVFTDAKGERPFAGQAVHPPVLDDLLAAFPEARVFLELKHNNLEAAEALCTLIRQHKAQESVLVGSFFDMPLRAFRRDCPDVATALAPAEARSFLTMQKLRISRFAPLDGVALVGPEVSDEGETVVSADTVKAAHARGLRVLIYTIDDPAQMKRFYEMGVDGIITNRPDLAVKVRAALSQTTGGE
jgi:glycerophosphoryl diester phosphodiesterase